MTFLDQLRDLIGEESTLADLARELGVSRPAVSQWKSGGTRPSSTHLAKLARLRGMKPWQIDQLLAAKARAEMDGDERPTEAA